MQTQTQNQLQTQDRITNEFEIYCPYKNEYRNIRATSLIQAIRFAIDEFNAYTSDFHIHDIIFVRVSHNPIFCMHTVSDNGFIARQKSYIHMNSIASYLTHEAEGKNSNLDRDEYDFCGPNFCRYAQAVRVAEDTRKKLNGVS